MALGGWVSGVIFDLTGSYQAAFVNGILWNLLNLGIAVVLLRRPAMPATQMHDLGSQPRAASGSPEIVR